MRNWRMETRAGLALARFFFAWTTPSGRPRHLGNRRLGNRRLGEGSHGKTERGESECCISERG